MEEVVAKEFSKRTDLKVQRRNVILQHSEYPWMLANVDRLIVGERVGLECKTSSEYLKRVGRRRSSSGLSIAMSTLYGCNGL